MEPTAFETPGGLEHQLAALYQEREILEGAIGVSDANQLVEMVQSMSAQLSSFYAKQEAEGDIGDGQKLREQVLPLASALQSSMGDVEVALDGRCGSLSWRMRVRPSSPIAR